jgi:hypothetical protein
MTTEADDPSALLGRLIKTTIPFNNVPYGLVQRFARKGGDEIWIYTSEHTDAGAVNDMWQHMPENVRLIGSASCPHARDFEDEATSVTVHEFISKRGETPIDRITPEKFFAAQVLGRLR